MPRRFAAVPWWFAAALASTAIADYLSFCRGDTSAPVGLVLAAREGVELAVLAEGRLVASQLLPPARVAAPREPHTPLVSALLDEAMTLANNFKPPR